MKTKNKVIIWAISISVGCLIFYGILTPAWWYFQQLVDPYYSNRVLKTWEVQNRSSNSLVKHLESRNWVFRSNAAYMLAKRKDINTIEPLIKLLQTSKDGDARDAVISILKNFDDPRVTDAFMKIVKAGRSHPDYVPVLRAFSIRKYEPVFKYVLEMAKIDDEDRAPAITMLEYFGKPEAIPALQKIANSDPKDYIREKAKKAIVHIKAEQIGDVSERDTP